MDDQQQPIQVLSIESSCGSSKCNANSNCYAAPVDMCEDGSRCIKLDKLYVNSPIPIPANTPESSEWDLFRKLCAEALGTGILIVVVVGSGIMAETLSPNDTGLQLLENAISTCGGLIGLILMFGPVSGAHFNPVVSFIDFLNEDMPLTDMIYYIIAQVIGGILGTLLANAEYATPICISSKKRDDYQLWIGELIGTITLLLVIHGCIRTGQKTAVPFAVGGWVCAGYFFTSSTIFANPAVTIARMFTDTFAGIEPRSAGIYIGFQFLGALVAYPLIKFFYPTKLSIKRDDNLYLRICIQSNMKEAMIDV